MTTNDSSAVRSGLRSAVCIAALTLLTLQAAGQTPDYSGEVCRLDDQTVLLTIDTDPSVQNILVYPTPPGGGWYLDQVSTGRFQRSFQVPTGIEMTFALLIQNPAQYSYPEHSARVDSGCVQFGRDDVMPPPIRGFKQAIEPVPEGALVTFEASPGDYNVPATSSVRLHHRVDGGELVAMEMESDGGRGFHALLQGVEAGMRVEYWFEQTIGEQPVDSVLFDRVLGEEEEVVDYPLQVRAAARFRDRHPNEWRFDHYVENYAGGKTFEIQLTDHGTSLDVRVVTHEEGGPERVDFKYYIQNNPEVMCDRPLTVINLNMHQVPGTNNVFEQRIPDITPGQIIEFDFTHLAVPNPAGGTFQYYTEYFYYHAGTGRLGAATANPRATAAGDASIPLVTAPRFSFAQHANNLTLGELDRFMEGKVRFETDHLDGLVKNFPTTFDCCSGPIGYTLDPSPHALTVDLGPKFNAPSCIACHMMDGRGRTPTGNESNLASLVIQLALEGVDDDGGPIPHPFYGRQFDTSAIGDTVAEGRVTVAYEDVTGSFDDGTTFTLRRPTYEFRDTAQGSPGSNLPDVDGTPGYQGVVHYSPRIAPMLAGSGLLEAIDEVEILALADPLDEDGDGISGRPNWVHDLVTGEVRIGRFGWKAGQPGLLQQTAVAYQRDLGLTSPLTPRHDCGDQDPTCTEESGTELSAGDVSLVADYVGGLTLPPRRNFRDPEAIIGMQLFKRANCQACHVPSIRTRTDHEIAAYRGQVIEPFTDMLLHDMGPDLADGFQEYEAEGSEWRTAPLWAAGEVGHVLGTPGECTDPYSGEGTPNYLHDGRARSLMEAILWHGGEAETSRKAVLAMNQQEREALLRYVAYPFDDPSLHDEPLASCPADLDGDGLVDGRDLAVLIDDWGQPGASDLDGSGTVDGRDLTLLLSGWGGCGQG
mgnify:CR=1 FL=1